MVSEEELEVFPVSDWENFGGRCLVLWVGIVSLGGKVMEEMVGAERVLRVELGKKVRRKSEGERAGGFSLGSEKGKECDSVVAMETGIEVDILRLQRREKDFTFLYGQEEIVLNGWDEMRVYNHQTFILFKLSKPHISLFISKST